MRNARNNIVEKVDDTTEVLRLNEDCRDARLNGHVSRMDTCAPLRHIFQIQDGGSIPAARGYRLGISLPGAHTKLPPK